MILTMFKDNVSEQVKQLHRQADEARDKGDYDSFFDCSYKALELVNGWIERMNVKKCKLLEGFEKDISNPNDDIQIKIGFNNLELAIKRVELGLGEPKFELKELNENILAI